MIKKLRERDSKILKYIHEFHAEYKNSPRQALIRKKFGIAGSIVVDVLSRLHALGYIDWIRIEGCRERIIVPLWKE